MLTLWRSREAAPAVPDIDLNLELLCRFGGGEWMTEQEDGRLVPVPECPCPAEVMVVMRCANCAHVERWPFCRSDAEFVVSGEWQHRLGQRFTCGDLTATIEVL